ncbi:hypothetical protein F5Y01DRAFT_2917 [Xylaria sp. FL0043]|nr:hypothetical protein F5Y01DRAFT_2917 [Xylaria sp. FL0043]
MVANPRKIMFLGEPCSLILLRLLSPTSSRNLDRRSRNPGDCAITWAGAERDLGTGILPQPSQLRVWNVKTNMVNIVTQFSGSSMRKAGALSSSGNRRSIGLRRSGYDEMFTVAAVERAAIDFWLGEGEFGIGEILISHTAQPVGGQRWTRAE